ncbi:hypothetical protein M1293_00095 [Candidatus Parvarchaeota archaeon]|nr:hypothetical protein [Candidatus Parvarchaeota archaeon]
MEEEEISVRCVLELMAKPEGAAVEALKKIVENMEENGKKLKITQVEYGDPKPMREGFFSAFARFTVTSDIESIFGFVLDYAPSSIEVLNKKNVSLSMSAFQALLNDISGRLNEMDEKIKVFSGQAIILSRQNEELKKKLEDKK